LKGVQVAVHDDCIVLRDAMVLEDESTAILNGEIVVPRERVLFMQLVDGVAV